MSNITIELLDYVYKDTGNPIDWDKSVVGELEVSSHTDFPLSLTFTIADIKDINSRKGSFSKTFKIPATKGNNQLYKSIYLANSTSANNLSNKKPCRILINNLYSIEGLLQLKSIGTSDKPIYYSCVFYGNNIGWANAIDEQLLKDLGTNGDAWDNFKGANQGKDITINKTYISSTWDQKNAQIKGTSDVNDIPIVFPIVSYGDYNPSGESKTIQLLETAKEYLSQSNNKVGYYGFNTSGFSYGTPEPVVDWRPCIFVYDVFLAIFREAGYRVVSDFMGTENFTETMFKKLLFALPNFRYNNAGDRYIANSFESNFKLSGGTSLIKDGASNYFDIDVTVGSGTPATRFDDVDLADSTGFNPDTNLNISDFDSDGVYTFPEYGKYDVILKNFGYWWDNVDDNAANHPGILCQYSALQIQVATIGEGNYVTIQETALDTELRMFQTTYGSPTNGQRYFEDLEFNRYFNKGDKIKIRLKNTLQHSGGTSCGFRLYLFGSNNIQSNSTASKNGQYNIGFNPEYAEYGQTFDLKNVINKEYKQIDFIKGVAHAFNLQFTTDEASKTIYVEPFDTFYKPFSEAEDWTSKVDRSTLHQDEFIRDALNRDIVFKYKTDDEDAKVNQRGVQYWKEILDEYPYFETLSNEFKSGVSTFENPFFAGTFNGKDLDTGSSNDPPYNACLWQEKEEGGFISPNDLSRPDKGFDFLPRLLYWKKYSPANIQVATTKYAVAQLWNGKFEGIFAEKNAPNVLSDIYPQATSIDRDDLSSPVLSYGNVYARYYNDIDGSYGTYVKAEGLYQTYYDLMIDMLKTNPRIRKININLKIKDIANLDMRKLIYIDGVYWRISKISNYTPQENKTTKVDLIEWVNLGSNPAYEPQLNEYDGRWNNTEQFVDSI